MIKKESVMSDRERRRDQERKNLNQMRALDKRDIQVLFERKYGLRLKTYGEIGKSLCVPPSKVRQIYLRAHLRTTRMPDLQQWDCEGIRWGHEWAVVAWMAERQQNPQIDAAVSRVANAMKEMGRALEHWRVPA